MEPGFCAAPFFQMTLKPNGQATPCCYNYGHHLGNVAQQGVANIWNGQKMQALRQEFLSGHVKSCRGRQYSLRCHERFAEHSATVTRAAILPYTPRRLDLRLNGTCNLSCVMCEVWQEPAGNYQHAQFWSDIADDIAPHLESCDILGGEPFVQQDTFKMLDTILAVNKNCSFAFVTNAHYPYSKRLDNYLRQIKIRYLQISLDSLRPEVYARIRHGSHALVMETVAALKNLRDTHMQPFELVFSMCVLRDNWEELPEFLNYCEQTGARPDLQYAYYDPSGKASLKYATREEIEQIDRFLSTTPSLAKWENVVQPIHAEVVRRKNSLKLSINHTVTRSGHNALS